MTGGSVYLWVRTAVFRGEGRRHGVRWWRRVSKPQDVGENFVAELRSRLRTVEEMTDRFLPADGRGEAC